MQKRRSAFWMKQLDERILEHLYSEGWATPQMMARDERFTASEGHIEERCQLLRDIEFIEPITNDLYELTTDGILYLHGRVDALHRPKPAVKSVLGR